MDRRAEAEAVDHRAEEDMQLRSDRRAEEDMQLRSDRAYSSCLEQLRPEAQPSLGTLGCSFPGS